MDSLYRLERMLGGIGLSLLIFGMVQALTNGDGIDRTTTATIGVGGSMFFSSAVYVFSDCVKRIEAAIRESRQSHDTFTG